MNYYLNATEWLEARRLRTDRVADFAAEVLDEWLPADEIENCAEVLEARQAADKAEGELKALEDALSEGALIKEFVTVGHENTDDEIRKFIVFAEDQEQQLEAIRDALVEGGVLAKDDTTSDLAGIIVMFVPPA